MSNLRQIEFYRFREKRFTFLVPGLEYQGISCLLLEFPPTEDGTSYNKQYDIYHDNGNGLSKTKTIPNSEPSEEIGKKQISTHTFPDILGLFSSIDID